jgi:hypothetical protein
VTAPLPDEPMTVRRVLEFGALVSVDYLLEIARDAGFTCLCRGRGQVESTAEADAVCPGCMGTGVAA